MRSEATVLSLLSGLAPPLPVGPVTERLPMPGTVTTEVPSGILPPGGMASGPLLPTQDLVPVSYTHLTLPTNRAV